MNKVKLGLIGCGKAGKLFLGAASNLEGVCVEAVSAAHLESARKVAEEYGINKYYAEWKELISDKKLNGVIVAAPDKYHAEMVIESARQGKDVLCEKPMCGTIEEAERMIEEWK